MEEQPLQVLASRLGIALIVRFGSTVTGRTHPGSDIDFGVLFEQMPGLEAELDVAAGLQALNRGREVDLAVLNRADPLLLKQVADAAVLEYGTPQRLEAFKRLAFKRYQDHRRFFDMERAYVERSIARGSTPSGAR